MSPDPPGLFAEDFAGDFAEEFAGLRWHRQLRKRLEEIFCLLNNQEVVAGRLVLYESRHNFFLVLFWFNVVEATQRSLVSRRK